MTRGPSCSGVSTRFARTIAIAFVVAGSSCSDSTAPEGGELTVPIATIADGNQQIGPVAAVLPKDLTVLVTDQHGNPLARRRVVFAVISGSGTLSPSEVDTDAGGKASAQWTLGTSVATPQQVVAKIVIAPGDTALVGTFSATPIPGPAQIAAVSGSGQRAAPDNPLPDSLLARVADRYGNPIANAQVTWAVISGGGSVSPTSGTTNVSGDASTQWTLGSWHGEHTASAALSGVPPVVFSAIGQAPTADIVVSITAPRPDTFVSDSISVAAHVESKYAIANVVASVGTRQATLAYSGHEDRWKGVISLGGVAYGLIQARVTATDVNGGSSTAATMVRHNAPPQLVVTAPEPYAVGAPSLAIRASCSSPDSTDCVELTASIGRQVLASGVSNLDATISLASYRGSVTLVFAAKDAAGQTDTVSRPVVAARISNASLRASVPGIVLDVSGSRVLFAPTSGTLKMRTLGGSDITLFDDANAEIGPAYLSPAGAIFIKGPRGDPRTVTEYRDGVVSELSTAGSAAGFVVKGGHAIWQSAVGFGPLTVRDLVNGASRNVASDAGNIRFDVSPAGDAAFWNSRYQVMFVPRGDTAIQVTADATLWNTYVLTDGINVVYRKHTPCCVNQIQTFQLTAWTSVGGEVVLAPARPEEPEPGRDFQVFNGWIAYTKPDNVGAMQIWSYSPTKVTAQVTNFGSSSTIEALGSNGEVVFTNGEERYLGSPPYGMPKPLGGPDGKVIYRDGRFLLLVGGSAFEVQ
jgi:hypothetical protein